jgi:hypothetical protein
VAGTNTVYSSSKVESRISERMNELAQSLIGGAGSAYDTFRELQTLLEADQSALSGLLATQQQHGARLAGLSSELDAVNYNRPAAESWDAPGAHIVRSTVNEEGFYLYSGIVLTARDDAGQRHSQVFLGSLQIKASGETLESGVLYRYGDNSSGWRSWVLAGANVEGSPSATSLADYVNAL